MSRRNGNGARIRAALAEGPVGASELGAILELPMRTCSAWLGMMRCKGETVVIGKIRQGRRFSNLYALSRRSA